MNADTVTIQLNEQAVRQSAVSVSPGLAITSFPEVERHVPLSIPSEQAYFWTPEWQAGERAAIADVAAGRVKNFSGEDLDEIFDWLDAD